MSSEGGLIGFRYSEVFRRTGRIVVVIPDGLPVRAGLLR